MLHGIEALFEAGNHWQRGEGKRRDVRKGLSRDQREINFEAAANSCAMVLRASLSAGQPTT